jgi:integration host factor subunit beta
LTGSPPHWREVSGFGAFSVKRRSARAGHNPRTGDEVSVDAMAVPHFRVSKDLTARMNRDAQ